MDSTAMVRPLLPWTRRRVLPSSSGLDVRYGGDDFTQSAP
jgi:hypothetical protein